MDPRARYLPVRENYAAKTSIKTERTAYLTTLDQVILWKEQAMDSRVAATTMFPVQIEVMSPNAWERFEKEIQEAKEQSMRLAA